jgi:hypothetical protein
MPETFLKRNLPVKMTAAEVAVKAQEFAQCWQQHDELEAEKKRVTAQLSSEMKRLRGEALVLRRNVTTGFEDRLVDCHREPNVVKRCWEIFRVDTGEKIETQQMTSDELDDLQQPDLPMVRTGSVVSPSAAMARALGAGRDAAADDDTTAQAGG